MPRCCSFPVERAKGDNLYSHYIFTKASIFVSLTQIKPPLTQSVLFSQEEEKKWKRKLLCYCWITHLSAANCRDLTWVLCVMTYPSTVTLGMALQLCFFSTTTHCTSKCHNTDISRWTSLWDRTVEVCLSFNPIVRQHPSAYGCVPLLPDTTLWPSIQFSI